MEQEKSSSCVKTLENKQKIDTKTVIEEFEEMSKNVEQVQRDTLRKILEQNAEAEYLQKLGMNGHTDIETFKQCVPLVTHKDLEHYIQRIMDNGNDSRILTGTPITHISQSSGTTQGKPKFLPFNDELFKNTTQVYKTSFAFRNRELPLGNGKLLSIVYGSKQYKTKGGLSAGTATTNVFRHPEYLPFMKTMQFQGCSPPEVIFGSDYHQSLYCHLLCGLLHYDEIEVVSSTFAHSIVQAFETFELVWEDLCSDIRDGTLNNRVTDMNTREAVGRILKPDPKLAEKIREICYGLNNWEGLVPEIFPNVKYIYGIMTGAMEPYLPRLRRYSGKVPLVCADYGASEGWVAVNVNPRSPPETATFAVLPNIGYFEFIPLMEMSNGGYEPKPIGLSEVEIGQEYEIIITTFGGLYRYRLGDVVRVMGFHNKTPKLKFVRRHGLVLNINIDKNTEEDLQLAVKEASKLLASENVTLVDFTSRVNLTKNPGHYVICWELSRDVDENVLKECCNCLDRAFSQDAGYLSSRKVGSIGALELRILGKGTFQKMVLHFVSMGGAASQFKVPRCIGSNNKALLQLLDDNVVESYISTAFG